MKEIQHNMKEIQPDTFDLCRLYYEDGRECYGWLTESGEWDGKRLISQQVKFWAKVEQRRSD